VKFFRCWVRVKHLLRATHRFSKLVSHGIFEVRKKPAELWLLLLIYHYSSGFLVCLGEKLLILEVCGNITYIGVVSFSLVCLQ